MFRILILFFPFVLTACDTWDAISGLISGNWADIICYFKHAWVDVTQWLINFLAAQFGIIAGFLPTVTLSQPNLNVGLFSTIAFFLPISEMATVISIFLAASLASIAGMAVLRWLKIVR